MRFIKAAELRSLKESVAKSTAGLIKEARARARPHVFLSHSHLDRDSDTLAGAVTMFERLDAPAYLDIDDSELPSITSVDTATGLRRRIDECRRLVVAASKQIRHSRWVPWEIGYADGRKGVAKVALLPIEADDGSLTVEQEYLATYPAFGMTNDGRQLIVRDPRDDRYWPVRYWLTEDIR
jgi:hypothetical protein